MAYFLGPVSVTSNLLYYYDAANQFSYPQSGSTWRDLSGLSNNATLSGTGFSTDFQGAITMPAGSETIVLNDNTSISAAFPSSSFTIIIAVRAKDQASPRSALPMWIQASNPVAAAINKGWQVGEGASLSAINVEVSDGVNYSTIALSHGVAQTTTYHRAFVVDRTNGCTTNYFVNGVLVGIASTSAVTGTIYTSGGFTFGNTAGWRFVGDIYMIQVYSRALSTSEVQQNFAAVRSRLGI
jgi:hypothetical protein